MKELQILQERYHDKGLEIFLFPSNTFTQEPCCDEDTEENYKKFGSTSHLMKKVSVNGSGTAPLYAYLKVYIYIYIYIYYVCLCVCAREERECVCLCVKKGVCVYMC